MALHVPCGKGWAGGAACTVPCFKGGTEGRRGELGLSSLSLLTYLLPVKLKLIAQRKLVYICFFRPSYFSYNCRMV